jgi:transcriptional regulator with XRE-family HTH domain
MQRRRLATQLQRLRHACGLTLEEVAHHLECSPAKVSRIENGQVAVRIQDARDLLDLYGVQGEDREAILRTVRQARSKGWWVRYADIIEEGTETLLSLEEEATEILIYETNQISVLLQCREYAKERSNSWTDLSADLRDLKADLSMDRRRALNDDSLPKLNVILDEATLRRAVGGPDVMREQYKHLLSQMDRPGTSVQVLPFSAGSHMAMGLPFCIFNFTGDDPSIAYVEMLHRGEFLQNNAQVHRYEVAFKQAHAQARSPEKSREFIEKLLAET